jgi:hypothetical protein
MPSAGMRVARMRRGNGSLLNPPAVTVARSTPLGLDLTVSGGVNYY